jgi:hypothetical protein
MAVLTKTPDMQRKGLGVIIDALWGSDGLLCLFLAEARSTAYNGGMVLAHHHGAGLSGVQEDDGGPFERPFKNSSFAGERPWGPGMDSSACSV